jgi:glutamate dehydrogenase (NADP+)
MEFNKMATNKTVESVYELVLKRNPGEKEFHQAVREVLDSLVPVLEENSAYADARILERIVEPERVLFRSKGFDVQSSMAR